MNIKIKFGLLSLAIILFQSVLKVIGVLLTGSLSFLSETVDTITDIFFVSITIYSVYKSEKPPDYEHMYGHSKIDSVGAMIQGIVLANIYCLLIFNAIQVIISGAYEITNPEVGLILLVISFSINLIFSRILIWQGKHRYSLALKIQGLNLFQDSMRAILVIVSFSFALFGIVFLDLFFSIALSVWIIIGALKLTKDGISDLTDTNPIKSIILEELRLNIFNLEHVIGVQELKIRVSSNILFLDVNLSVEDHISIVHANRITKSIRTMSNQIFPHYEVECFIQMNPLSSEHLLGDVIINLIHSKKADFPEILEVRELNLFVLDEKEFLSLVVVVDGDLSLEDAHKRCTEFESELKEEAPFLSRIITHIEGEPKKEVKITDKIVCESFKPEQMEEITRKIEDILNNFKVVKGFHGLECWTAFNYCILELHIFFEGSLNVSRVHQYITDIEKEIRENIDIEKLQEIILHSEPLIGRTEGVFLDKN